MKDIYLDNNATTKIDARVLQEMTQAYTTFFANPSSIHQMGKKAKHSLDAARNFIAQYFSSLPSEITFTSGGTESLNFLLRGIELPLHKRHIITSSIEHAAVYETLKDLEDVGYTVTYLPVGHSGKVHLDQVQKALRPNTGMLVFSAANTETGVLADLEALAHFAQKNALVFVVDAIGVIGKMPWNMYEGISAFAISGHKFHGPQGIGLAYIREDIQVRPLLTGGAQEREKRAGTQNLPAILGLAKALEILQEELFSSIKNMQALREHFEATLQSRFPEIQINGEAPRLCNTSNLFFEGIDAEVLLMQLDMQHIAASLGPACSSGALEPSKTLTHMYGQKRALCSIRFSLSRMTTRKEIENAIEVISSCVERLLKLHA